MFGCDLDYAALRDRHDATVACMATLDELPYADGTFDLVTSNMVFEHLDNPERAVAELVRVTRPTGRILVHTVNARHMTSILARITPHSFHEWLVDRVEGRRGEDVYPTRYRANTEEQLCELFGNSGWVPAWGGLVSTIPYFVPYPGAFWVAFLAGVVELRLSRSRTASRYLKSNILMEFQSAQR